LNTGFENELILINIHTNIHILTFMSDTEMEKYLI